MDDAKKAMYEQELFNKTQDEGCVKAFNKAHDLVVALGNVSEKQFPHMFKSTVCLLVGEFVDSDKYEEFFDSIYSDLLKFETDMNIKTAEKFFDKSKIKSKRKRIH